MHSSGTQSAHRFVDSHVHIKDVRGLDALAAAGIVAVRDAGTRDGSGLEIVRSRERRGVPVVVSSGRALYKKGGYGALIGTPVTSRGEIKSEILNLKDAGAGIIKVMASGLVSFTSPGLVTAGGFSRDELAFIVRCAAESGLDVMAHANGEEAILASVEAGIRSLEHGFFMTERALDVMRSKETYWVPTVGALQRAAGSGRLSREAEQFVARLLRRHVEMIGRAHAVGVPLAIGTDCVLPDPKYQAAYDAELGYFEQSGVPRESVLRIACEGGAQLLGLC
jgi:imidazolonepropionase-like amidohydrolase